MNDRRFDYCFKLLSLGDSFVGKTSLTNVYMYNQMSLAHCGMGSAFHTKTLKIDDTVIHLEIWDTCGEEKYTTLSPLYYRGSSGVMLVYDVTNRQSFDNLRDKWYRDMCLYTDKHTQCILIGNKCDLESERVVECSTGKKLADSLSIPFIESSARDSINVEQAFVLMTGVIMSKIAETESHPQHNIQLSEETGGSSTQKCYC